jgi:hypothetical protein
MNPGYSQTDRFLQALRSPGATRAVELRPPPAALGPGASVEAWIDLRHSVRRLLREDRFVLFTDDAVGTREEESLRHLVDNLGPGTDLSGVVPFLTLRHSLDYCTYFARRTRGHGMGGLTVTGGDEAAGTPRCLPRSRDLRARIRESTPGLPLGVWTNPLADPETQAGYLTDDGAAADYFLTQVVSHHHLPAVDRFLEAAEGAGLTMPGLFGVFYYRSANPRTLERLENFLPVPTAELTREFSAGASPEEVCARTLRALRERGVEKVYLCNLDLRSAPGTLARIEALV